MGSAVEQTPSRVESVGSGVFTSENALMAGDYAKGKVGELRTMASDGDISIRLLALLGGFAMATASVVGFLSKVLSLHFLAALVEVYTFFLGVVVILLEGKIPFSQSFLQRLHKHALFLKFVWGRGCLYFVAGSLQATQADIVDLVVGGFMCIIGIMYIIVGQRTAKKLADLHKSLFSEQKLKEKFHQADTEGNGTLTIGQFKTLTVNLGLDLNRREVEAAFMHLDKEDNGQLTYEEFQSWWTEWDDHDIVGDSAFEFVAV